MRVNANLFREEYEQKRIQKRNALRAGALCARLQEGPFISQPCKEKNLSLVLLLRLAQKNKIFIASHQISIDIH